MIQSEYCRLNKLSQKSFSNWKFKHARQSGKNTDPEIPVFTSSPTPIPLIPVAISEQMESVAEIETKAAQQSNSGFSGVTLINNDYQISLAIGFHPNTLKSVLTVLVE